MNIEQGLEHLLEHFAEPIFPRTISTKSTGNKQVQVNSVAEVLEFFRDANLYDCRVSAFSKKEIDDVIDSFTNVILFMQNEDGTFKRDESGNLIPNFEIS